MSILASIKGAQLGAKLGRFAIGLGMMALVVFLSFQWGKTECRKDQIKADAKIAADHADTVNTADRAATARALDSQEKDLNNERDLADIVRHAEGEVGADDLCLSADVVERLRELQ